MATNRDRPFQALLGLCYAAGAIVVLSAAGSGFSYYLSPYADRPHHPGYSQLRPSGALGHAYGMAGSALLCLLLLYSLRKRWHFLDRWGTPAQWLQLHICFGIVGPLLIILHTSFKVQGLVAVSFWSMVAVALSGVFGRWLYLQIPRNLAGHELSRKEIEALERELAEQMVPESNPRDRARLARRRAKLERNVRRLETIRGIFHWWHVVHKPFAIIMLLIMVVHIAVVLSLGYTWIL